MYNSVKCRKLNTPMYVAPRSRQTSPALQNPPSSSLPASRYRPHPTTVGRQLSWVSDTSAHLVSRDTTCLCSEYPFKFI